MKKKVENALTDIRKELNKQGKDVELKSASELGAIELKLTGNDSLSLSQRVSTELELEGKLKKMVPGIKFVRLTVC